MFWKDTESKEVIFYTTTIEVIQLCTLRESCLGPYIIRVHSRSLIVVTVVIIEITRALISHLLSPKSGSRRTDISKDKNVQSDGGQHR